MIAGMFKGKRDNTQIETYPTKPYKELEKEKRIQKQLEIKNKKYIEYQNSLVYFGTLKQQYLDKLKKKGE